MIGPLISPASGVLQAGQAAQGPRLDLDFINQVYVIDGRRYASLQAALDTGVIQASGGAGGRVMRNGAYVAASAPRVGDDGLLMEPAGENRYPSSATFEQTTLVQAAGPLRSVGEIIGLPFFEIPGQSADTYLQFNAIDLTGIAVGEPVVFSLFVRIQDCAPFSLWVGVGNDDIARTRARFDPVQGTAVVTGDPEGVTPIARLDIITPEIARVSLTSVRMDLNLELELCRVEEVTAPLICGGPQFERGRTPLSPKDTTNASTIAHADGIKLRSDLDSLLESRMNSFPAISKNENDYYTSREAISLREITLPV